MNCKGCDPNRPTRHKLFCGDQSVCEVIKQNPDFNATVPLNIQMPPKTQFRLVKSINTRYVLVLDVSGSMATSMAPKNQSGGMIDGGSCSRIGVLKQAAMNFLNSSRIRDGDQIGIVTFRLVEDIIICFRKIN